MSTKDTTKPAKVKRVRQLIPVNAIVWVPGTELPPQIQRLVDDKIEAWAKDYDEEHSRRLKNFRPPAEVELGKIVNGLFYQLSGVYFEHGIEAVGLFLQELKAKAATRLKNEEGTLELAQTAYTRATLVRDKLDQIIAGTLQITVPEKRFAFQPGGSQSPDRNLKTSDHHGEAVVSKRAAD